MRFNSRASRSLASVLALLLIVPSAVSAQTQNRVNRSAVAADAAAAEVPWLYRDSDVPQDKEWKFGELANGMRYVVRQNGVPPGQVSIRIRMDVGSLHERDHEQGYAHLLEHLVFRQSKYLGQGQAIPTWQRLGATFGSDTNFTACAREFQARHRRKGIIVVISDFLFPSGFDDGLKFLQWNRHEVFCLQVQDENDTKCDWKGDVELTCVETGQRQRLTITPREAKLYEQAVADWNESLRKCCAKRGIGLASTTPRVPFEAVITDILRRGGLVA